MSSETKCHKHQMSGGTKCLEGQNIGDIQIKKNVRRDKASGDTTSFWLIFNTYILKTSITILYYISSKFIILHTCRKNYFLNITHSKRMEIKDCIVHIYIYSKQLFKRLFSCCLLCETFTDFPPTPADRGHCSDGFFLHVQETF